MTAPTTTAMSGIRSLPANTDRPRREAAACVVLTAVVAGGAAAAAGAAMPFSVPHVGQTQRFVAASMWNRPPQDRQVTKRHRAPHDTHR